MSKIADQADLATELRLQIDELATTLVLNGPGAWLDETLKQVAESSGRAGYANIGQIASNLVSQLSACDAASPASDELLRQGLAAIQQALETPVAQSQPSGEPAPAVNIPQASFSLNSLAQDPELVGDFIMESREHLGSIENNMLTLERNPEEKEAVHAVFRGFHTIKGLAGFMELMPIRDVAHEVETLLDLARNG